MEERKFGILDGFECLCYLEFQDILVPQLMETYVKRIIVFFEHKKICRNGYRVLENKRKDLSM